RAVKSRPWPGTASLEVSLVWIGPGTAAETLTLDGHPVRGITPGLDAASRASGNPHSLAENEDQSFQGAIVLGKGFVLPYETAQTLISQDERNRDVLFPYLNGE